MISEPAASPVTDPPDDDTIALVMSLLFQVPPVVASASGIVCPMHTATGPVIGAAIVALTVTFVMVIQPVGNVKVMGATPPVPTPVARPVPSIVATVVAPLVQVPVPLASFNNDVVPVQKVVVPPIANGNAFTVTGADTAQPELMV